MSDVSVGFGAQDEGLNAALRKLNTDLAMAERSQGRIGGSSRVASQGMMLFGRSMLGPLASLARFGPLGGVIAAMGGAWLTAAKGAEAYAKINKEAQREMDVTKLKAEGLWQTLGKKSNDLLGFNALGPIKSLEQGLANWVGVDPAVQQGHFDTMIKDQRLALDLALARDDAERAFLRSLQMETAEYEKQRQHHRNMQQAGLLTESHRAGLDRALGDTHRGRLEAIFAAENERRGSALEDERRKEREAARLGDEMIRDVWEKSEAHRESLRTIEEEARIEALMAMGREKEARLEQVRIQTRQKLLEIGRKDLASEEERLAAMEAVRDAEAAKIRTIEEPAFRPIAPFTGRQTIEAGLGGGALGRQVFGPGDASGGGRVEKRIDEVKRELASQTSVLKSIESKIGSVGSFAP